MIMTKLTFLSTLMVGAAAATEQDAYYKTITAGQKYSCGVLESTGRVECWGNGVFGSLDLLESRLKDEKHLSISGGGVHVCGLYFDSEDSYGSDGGYAPKYAKAYCAKIFADGDPELDELYDMGQFDIPALEGDGKYWREISAGGQHTCGIDSDRMVHCWGSEEGNRRNLGDFADMKHRHISAGGMATCGVLMDHTGYCVGNVPQGNLPEEYEETEFSMLEAGGAFSYGLVKVTKEIIKFGPSVEPASTILASIPTTPPKGFRSIKTLQIAAGSTYVCAIGRRNRKAIKNGLPGKGAWCGGTEDPEGDEVTGISPEA